MFGGRSALEKEMGNHPTSYSWTRGFATTLAVSVLMSQGHSYEDIMNPDKLQAEKLAAGREVIEHTRADDHAWIGGKLHDGYMALIDETDRLMSSFNVADPRHIQDHYAEVSGRSYLLFDLYQEVSRAGALEGFLARAEEVAPGTSIQRQSEMVERVQALGSLQQGMDLIVDGKIALSNPNLVQRMEPLGKNQRGIEVGKYLAGAVVTQQFAQAMRKGAPASRAIGGTEATNMITSVNTVEMMTIMGPVNNIENETHREQIYRAVQHLAAHDRLNRALPTKLSRQPLVVPVPKLALGEDGKAVTTTENIDIGSYTLKMDRAQFLHTLQEGAKKVEAAREMDAINKENAPEVQAKRAKDAAAKQAKEAAKQAKEAEKAAAKQQKQAAKTKPPARMTRR